MRRTASCLLSVAALLLSSAARAELLTVSPEKANVRDGPGLEHEVLWVADQYTVATTASTTRPGPS